MARAALRQILAAGRSLNGMSLLAEDMVSGQDVEEACCDGCDETEEELPDRTLLGESVP